MPEVTTSHDLLQAVRENPTDTSLWLVCADLLEEEGQEVRAEFFRAVVEYPLTPAVSDSGKTFYWWYDEQPWLYPVIPWNVEPELFKHLKAKPVPRGKTWCVLYRSLQAAYADLEQAWVSKNGREEGNGI